MPPALLPEIPAISNRPSSSSASRTPQVKAPCEPPPFSASEILFFERLLRGRLEAVTASSLDGERGRAVPIRRRRLDSEIGTARAVDGIEDVLGLRFAERCDSALGLDYVAIP